MAKNNNLQDFLKDVADSIRTKTQTTDPINAQDFSDKILSIQTGGGEDRLKKLLDATKQTRNLFFGYNGTSVDDLIQYSDTENVTRMDSMFTLYKLTTIPLLNTSNVTSMNNMFEGCTNITTVPQFDTSKVTSMSNMFYNCPALTSIPQFDTSKVTGMGAMFYQCTRLSTIPLLNTSNVLSTAYMFFACSSLTTVPALDVNKVYSADGMFNNCSNLKSILMTNIGFSLNISASTKFERSDLLVILNNLKTVTSSKTLTMGETNLAKLTDEDKAIAINKGWTLA